MKKIICTVLVFVMLPAFSSCCLTHDYEPASCTSAEICKKCGKENGEPLGHTWVEATCEAAKTCEVCGETEGEPLGHTWVEATCKAAKTCEVCGATEGKRLEHTWIEATLTEPKTCSVCGLKIGDKLSEAEYYSNMLVGKWYATSVLDADDNPWDLSTYMLRLINVEFDENYIGKLFIYDESYNISVSSYPLVLSNTVTFLWGPVGAVKINLMTLEFLKDVKETLKIRLPSGTTMCFQKD